MIYPVFCRIQAFECVDLFYVACDLAGCFVVPSSSAGQNVPNQQAAAILHARGAGLGSTGTSPGDTFESKSGATVNLVLDGSTALRPKPAENSRLTRQP